MEKTVEGLFWKSKVEALFLESKLTTVLRPAYLDYKWLGTGLKSAP
jgi:hypothetical protein